ncbi:hypothetical protein WJX73_002415 [Symbiochloris irregularis]|uniref:t-SNARE coiled-coil homology domain-containing protein n=1 Tax=Symbiochloris irregularis TaxID=706552 RepID=A0AAW1NLW9_9CHLO
MGVDQTQVLWERAQAHAKAGAVDEARLEQLRSAQILRSFAARSNFTDVALQVAQNVENLTAYVQQNRRDYVQPGRLSEVERDRVEAQVGDFIRTCKQNIVKLQDSVAAERASLSTDTVAHRLGVALVLSERLQLVGAAFDRARMLRYQQKQQQQRDLQRRQKHVRLSPTKPTFSSPTQNGLHTSYGNPAADSPPSALQEQALAQESAALMAELESVGKGAFQVESTMHELATLNQMFASQIVQQAEQIELLYNQAVDATANVDRGNVHLKKAIRMNTSARWYMFYILIIAALCLLFIDWYSS